MTNLEKLTAEIQKSVPRLMELKKGCILKTKKDDFTIYISHINGKLYKCFDIEDKTSLTYELHELHEYFNVVGAEPMLNDVLEWLNEMSGKRYCITSDGRLMLEEFIFGNYKEIDLWLIDLSKPHLKEQCQELINYLFSLIKK